jgi:hypothetical protein
MTSIASAESGLLRLEPCSAEPRLEDGAAGAAPWASLSGFAIHWKYPFTSMISWTLPLP